MSRNTNDFDAVKLLIKTYQDMLEIETVSTLFKSVLFKDMLCSLYNKDHMSLDCLSLKSIVERGINSDSNVMEN